MSDTPTKPLPKPAPVPPPRPKLSKLGFCLIAVLVAVPLFLWTDVLWPGDHNVRHDPFSTVIRAFGSLIVFFGMLEIMGTRESSVAAEAARQRRFAVPLYRFLGGICAVVGVVSFLVNRFTGHPTTVQVLLFTMVIPLYYYLVVRLILLVERLTARHHGKRTGSE